MSKPPYNYMEPFPQLVFLDKNKTRIEWIRIDFLDCVLYY